MPLPNGIVEAVPQAALSLAGGYIAASASWLLRKSSSPWRWGAFIILSGVLLACPFLVPRPFMILRGFISAVIVWWWLKTWDALHRSMAADTRFPQHLASLLNFGLNVTPSSDSQHRVPPFTRRWYDVIAWGSAFCFACALIYCVFGSDWSGLPFMAEHLAKVASLMVGLVLCGLNFHSALWRFGGAGALHSPLASLWSASPAEFWRRWNRPVQQWLFEYVFMPIKGTRCMATATVAAFAVSGVMHEYIVSMATGRITGYPTAFFLLQSLGVLATARLDPRGWRRVFGVTSTWAFNAVTSVLLFAPLGATLPFYANQIPYWTRPW